MADDTFDKAQSDRDWIELHPVGSEIHAVFAGAHLELEICSQRLIASLWSIGAAPFWGILQRETTRLSHEIRTEFEKVREQFTVDAVSYGSNEIEPASVLVGLEETLAVRRALPWDQLFPGPDIPLPLIAHISVTQWSDASRPLVRKNQELKHQTNGMATRLRIALDETMTTCRAGSKTKSDAEFFDFMETGFDNALSTFVEAHELVAESLEDFMRRVDTALATSERFINERPSIRDMLDKWRRSLAVEAPIDPPGGGGLPPLSFA